MMRNKILKRNIRRRSRRSGFTFLELLFVAGAFLFVIIAIMRAFLYFFAAEESSENKLKALYEVKDKVEEIRNESFDNIYADYNGTTFALNQVHGMGVVRVNNANSGLLDVEVLACWKSESGSGRVIGEDKNLNGSLDAGEDTDGNGEIDSPLTIRTLITR